MADVKISAMSAAGTLDGTEIVPLIQSGANKRTTTQAIADLGGGSSGLVLSVTTGATPTILTDISADLIEVTTGGTGTEYLDINDYVAVSPFTYSNPSDAAKTLPVTVVAWGDPGDTLVIRHGSSSNTLGSPDRNAWAVEDGLNCRVGRINDGDLSIDYTTDGVVVFVWCFDTWRLSHSLSDENNTVTWAEYRPPVPDIMISAGTYILVLGSDGTANQGLLGWATVATSDQHDGETVYYNGTNLKLSSPS